MALSNAQLLMLNNLIYTDFCSDNKTVGEIVNDISNKLQNGGSIGACEMNDQEWADLVNIIKKDDLLLSYTVSNYEEDSSGMRAACFIDDANDPADVNVVFRGTISEYEWVDNGKGAYLPDSQQQKLALKYVDKLPKEYGDAMTVTGHSKGGNKAMYVTIEGNRIARCVSFDGQGFSPEFIRDNKPIIEKKAGSIISISAENDFVNCLLYPIAGTQMYIRTEDQSNFIHNHKPNILLDENGNLREETEKSEIAKIITDYTTYMISNLDDPERSMAIDGAIDIVISFLASDSDEIKKALIRNIVAEVIVAKNVDDYLFNVIGDAYGYPAEVVATYVAANIFPLIFIDDMLKRQKEMIDDVHSRIKDFANIVVGKFNSIGDKAADYGKKFMNAVDVYTSRVSEWFNSNFNSGYKAASSNPIIVVDTTKLRSYADRLERVNNRLKSLDKRMNSLYTKVDLLDVLTFLKADLMTGYSKKISNCAKYLDETANDFDKTERNVVGEF